MMVHGRGKNDGLDMELKERWDGQKACVTVVRVSRDPGTNNSGIYSRGMSLVGFQQYGLIHSTHDICTGIISHTQRGGSILNSIQTGMSSTSTGP